MRKLFVLFSLFIFILSACSSDPSEQESQDKLEVETLSDIRVRQRETILIKGNSGDVSLYLGDITKGQCLIEITGKQKGKEYLYLNRPLQEHDSASFTYGDSYYRVITNGFELHLVHDDFAFLTVREISEEQAKNDKKGVTKRRTSATKINADKVNEYIRQIDQSKCTFIRDGYSKSGHEFAEFLLVKIAANKRDLRTDQDFREIILTRSNETGEPYKVVTEKGDTLQLNEWIKW